MVKIGAMHHLMDEGLSDLDIPLGKQMAEVHPDLAAADSCAAIDVGPGLDTVGDGLAIGGLKLGPLLRGEIPAVADTLERKAMAF